VSLTRCSLVLRHWLAIALVCGVALTPSGMAAQTTAFEQAIQDQFLRSMVLVEQGEYQQAIRLLRGILKHDPELHRVRLELARAYFLAREWELSRREFFTVLSSDIPAGVRRTILSFLRMIDQRRGWSWGATLALTTGQFGLRKYETDQVTLDVFGQPLEFEVDRSDPPSIGLEYGGYLELREMLDSLSSEQQAIGVGIRVSGDSTDFEGSKWDDDIIDLRGNITVSYPETTIEFGPAAAYRWFGKDPYEKSLGGNAVILNRSLTDVTLTAGVSGRQVDNMEFDARDGALIGGRAGGSLSFVGTTILGASISFFNFNAKEKFESYDEYGSEFFASSDMGYGVTATIRPSVFRASYEAKAPFFTKKRKDWDVRFRTQLTKNDIIIFEYSPFISFEYGYHESNIGIYSYQDFIFRLGMTKSY